MLLIWPLAVLTASLGRSDLWLAGVHRQPEDERERGGDRDHARPGGDRECVRGRMAGEGREEDRSQGGDADRLRHGFDLGLERVLNGLATMLPE